VRAGKIVPLRELAPVVAGHKAAGRTVVLAHGVFDLMHLGHIRHFQDARRQGDVLVVTVTPDRFVNKGPGRPVFTERLRAETIAALETVDHVAVNESPTAVETIRLLQPSVYAKGSDYERSEDDLTGEITNEERAVREAGGRMYFSHDIEFSSSHLLNSHFELFNPETSAFLESFRSRHSADDIIGLLRSFERLHVAVVGDAIIDEYVYCRAYGMASKSASIAAQELEEEPQAGGAFAIANHLAGFCGSVELITCLGAQDSREDFVRSRLAPNVDCVFLTRPDAPTTVKRRYVNAFLLSKMFETSRYNDAPLPDDVERELLLQIERRLPHADIVVVADFGHGLIGRNAIDALAERARFLALNAQTNSINHGYNVVTRYRSADYVSIDAEEAHLAHGDRAAALDGIIDQLATTLGARMFAITRGHHGSLVRGTDGSKVEVPVFSREVVDSIGAGDAFLAVTAPVAATTPDPELVGFVGNAVGALAVRIVGNKEPVDRVTLFKFVAALLK
jgi:rfaE bifunctional protein nucleotidyltransferase chain/domain